jgi:signal recognition particle receptor subunit beta
MVQFRPQSREIIVKVVYYGPPLGGKTTNLRSLYEGYPASVRGELVVVPTGGDRTIFFDFLPIYAGELRGMQLRVQLYTVPGQVHYNSTRQVVLRGVDGVVFVADSQRELLHNNRESWENLKDNLLLQGVTLGDLAHVLQYNKRDLADIVDIGDLDQILNEYNAPFYEAISTQGIGVEETLQGIVKLVVRSLRERFRVAIEPEEIQAQPTAVAPPAQQPPKQEVARVFSFTNPPSPPAPAPAPPKPSPPVRAPAPDFGEVFTAPPGNGRQPVLDLPSTPPPAPPPAPSPAPEPFAVGAARPPAAAASAPEAPAGPFDSEEPPRPGSVAPPVAAPAPPPVRPPRAQTVAVEPATPPAPARTSLPPQLFEEVPPPATAFEPAPTAAAPESPFGEATRAETTFDVPASPPTVPDLGRLDTEVTHKIKIEAAVADAARETLQDPFQLNGPPAAAAFAAVAPADSPAGFDDVFAIVPASPVRPAAPEWKPEVEPEPEPAPADRAAEAASLAVQRVIPRAIAQYGEVRELELEVPVPAMWVGGKRMTLQLRLTLVPQEE